jgi:competence protein ComEC
MTLKSLLGRCVYIYYTIALNPAYLAGLVVSTGLLSGVEVAVLGSLTYLVAGGLFSSRASLKLQILTVIFSLCLVQFCQMRTVKNAEILLAAGEKIPVTMTAKITNYPQQKLFKNVVSLQPNLIIFAGQQEQISEKFLVRVSIPIWEKIQIGDQVKINCELQLPENFAEFDYQQYLQSQEILYLCEGVHDLEIVGDTRSSLDQISLNLRQQITQLIRKRFPEPHAALLLGMLIGTKEEFSPEFATALKLTGTNHIIAVSGFNVTIVVASILKLAGKLPRRLVIIGAMVMLIIFAMLVGLDNIPALRAVIMGEIVCIGSLLGRKSSVLNLLVITAIILVVNNPLIINSLSFQLSFAATLGLVLLADDFANKFPDWVNENIKTEAATTLAATLATFPVTFRNFGQLTWWSLIVNVLLAGLIVPIMLLGFIFVLSELFFPYAAQFFFYLTWSVLQLMVWIISSFAKIPWGYYTFTEQLDTIANIVLILIVIYIFEKSYRQYAQNQKLNLNNPAVS